MLCSVGNRKILQVGKNKEHEKNAPPPIINIFVHVVGCQSVSLMIFGIAVDAALKQGD